MKNWFSIVSHGGDSAMKRLLALTFLALLSPSLAWAAFPVVAASNTSQNLSDVTTHTVNLPASIAAGNLLCVAFAVDENAALSGAGWTQFDLAVVSTGNVEYGVHVRCKIATGSEGATASVTSDTAQRSAHITFRITGHHASTAPSGTIDGASTTDVNPNPPSHNPVDWDVEDTLWIAGYLKNVGSDTQDAIPTSYSGGLYSVTTDGTANGVGVGIATRQNAVAAEDPATFTISVSRAWRAFTVGVRPAAATARRRPAARILP